MEKELRTFIKEFKEGEINKFTLIVEKMKPMINKYVRLLYKEEKEDMQAEMELALLEAVLKMNYYEEEAQCVSYLCRSIKNKFLELYSKSRNQFDHTTKMEENFVEEIVMYKQKEYDNFILKEDLHKLCSGIKGNKEKRIVYSIFIEEQSDQKIAVKYQVSRQYVNRMRRKYYQLLREEYFT